MSLSQDFCGFQGHWTADLVPEGVGSVDFSYCCEIHDQAVLTVRAGESEAWTVQDDADLALCVGEAFLEEGSLWWLFVLLFVPLYFIGPRIGRLLIWLKSQNNTRISK